MSTTDNVRQGHVVLSAVFTTLALGVLLASVVMAWWVPKADDGGHPTEQVTTSAEASHSPADAP
jgi:hypothetical protein